MLLLGVAVIAGTRQADGFSKKARKELDRLQGQWVLKGGERLGKKFEVNDATLVLEIKGVKWVFTGVVKGELVAIDPETNPKCFDLKSLEQSTRGQVHEGIYRISGDTLTVCLNEKTEKQRPLRFETNPQQPDTILAVLQRVKK
jgi:uncharacterized protein (TIGR03067 family)